MNVTHCISEPQSSKEMVDMGCFDHSTYDKYMFHITLTYYLQNPYQHGTHGDGKVHACCVNQDQAIYGRELEATDAV